MKSKLKITAVLCIFFTMFNIGVYAKAETRQGVENYKNDEFMVEVEGEEVNFKVKEIDENNLKIETVTNGNEYHEVYVNRESETLILDGKEISLQKETYIKTELSSIKTELSSIKPELSPGGISTFEYEIIDGGGSGSAWSPIYLYTNRYSFSDIVTSIGACATVVGGVIALAVKAGVAIATSVIATEISTWASIAGLGTLVAGYTMNGHIYSDTYRTSLPVPTGYGKTLYAYRYEDIGAYFTLKSKVFDKILKSTGGWWFAEKPY